MQGHVNEPSGFAFKICHREPEKETPALGMPQETLERSQP
jgi:hypothetical protein